MRDVYFIVVAEDKEDARELVESWLDDYQGREFYDRHIVSDDAEVVGEIGLEAFRVALSYAQSHADTIKRAADRHYADGNMAAAGYQFKRLGSLLMQSFSEGMPYWNLATEDWSLPGEHDWAVLVTLR